MKKYSVLLFIITCLFNPILADVNPSNINDCFEQLSFCLPACGVDRTFMFTHPLYRNIAAQYSLWHDFVFNACSGHNVSVQVMPMYSDSVQSQNVVRYFLYDDKKFLTVRGDEVIGRTEDNQGNQFNRDIRAEWLFLPSNFQGGFTVNPQQSQFALWLEAKVNLRTVIDHFLCRHLWVAVAAPFQVVENDIRLQEVDPLSTGTAFPNTVTQALSNPTLRYAKFGPSERRSSFAELYLKFGSNFLEVDGFQIGTYSLIVLPMSQSNDPGFVFSPYLGSNGHVGFGFGATFQFPLNYDIDCKLISFFFYAENIYYIRNFQHRTLDLNLKPYSRYLLLVNKDGRRNVPAVNVLTRNVRVRPYNMADVVFGFRYQKCGLETEIGYGLWLRGRQALRLKECFPDGEWGIQGVGFIPDTLIPATASESTIQNQAENDVDPNTGNQIFVPINAIDLQINSGAARGALNQRAHIAGGYLWETPKAELFIGVGAFFEVPEFNTDLKRWGVWAKWGISV